MNSTNSLRGHKLNKFTGESHAKSRQRGWNPWPWINPCKHTLHPCSYRVIAQTRNTPTIAAFMKPSSFMRAFVLFLPRKARKEKTTSTLSLSVWRKRTDLKTFLLCFICLLSVNNTEREDGQVTYATPFSRALPYTSSVILINSDV